MTVIIVPHPTDPSCDERHGPARWVLTLSNAHRVWELAGIDLRGFAGRTAEDCMQDVRDLIQIILDDPDHFIGRIGYYDLRATTAALTELFFVLRERPTGIVQVNP
jgi:hypothetical protein